MRTIIAGGTGLIGSALACGLLKSGNEVYILSRAPEKYASASPAGAKLLRWDGKSGRDWANLIDANTAIVNLAGSNLGAGRWTAQRRKEILESRSFAGQAVVEAVTRAEQKPFVVLQSSAVGYYGDNGEAQLTEKSAGGHDFGAQVCQVWENATAEVESMGVRRAIFRTGVVISTQGGAFPRLLLPFRFFVGGPVGNGKQWFPWIHLDDEIAAIRFLLENQAARGIFNLGAPNPVRQRELAKAIGKTIHRPALIPAPAFALKIVFGEMASVLLASQRMLPEKLTAAGFSFKFPQIDAALRDILG